MREHGSQESVPSSTTSPTRNRRCFNATSGMPDALLTARWEVSLGSVASNIVIFATVWLIGDNLQTRRANVAAARARFDVPIAAYQVSGEFAMIAAAAERGWLDGRRAMTEAVTAIVRAGAGIVITYAAADLATWLREEGER